MRAHALFVVERGAVELLVLLVRRLVVSCSAHVTPRLTVTFNEQTGTMT